MRAQRVSLEVLPPKKAGTRMRADRTWYRPGEDPRRLRDHVPAQCLPHISKALCRNCTSVGRRPLRTMEGAALSVAEPVHPLLWPSLWRDRCQPASLPQVASTNRLHVPAVAEAQGCFGPGSPRMWISEDQNGDGPQEFPNLLRKPFYEEHGNRS